MDVTKLKQVQPECEQPSCVTESRFWSLSVDLLCIAGFDGYFKRLNPAWETTLGYTSSELLAQPYIEFVHPEDLKVTIAEAQKVITGGSTIKFENRYRCKDGSYKWLSWTATPFAEEGLIYAVARDITYRVEAEENLRKSEETNRALLNAIPDMLFRCKKDGTYIDFKPANNIKTVVPPSGFIGKKVQEILPPELAQRILQAHEQAISSGETQFLEYQLFIDDRLGDYEARIVASGCDEVISIVRDISDRKALERELALKEARLNAFFAAAPIGIKILDDRLRFVQINEPLAEINALPVRDHIGKTIREVLPEIAPQLEAICQEVMRTGVPILNLEMRGEVPSLPGIVRDWLVSYFPIFDEDNRPSGVGAVVMEITDRKQALEALRQQLLRERLMKTILERIRSSLNLEEVLKTAVEEVRQFLQTDRTVIYRFNPDWGGVVAVESVAEGWMPTLGIDIQDECFIETHVPLYQKGRLRAIADIHNAGLNECHVNLLSQLQVKANLVVPLLQGENLWGLLIAHHCTSPREWHSWEIECLRQMSVQLAIAIQQSTLFEQAQTEIADRKAAEIALQESEARERQQREKLEIALYELQNTQSQLVQQEKMASLGQLVAGVAHEINNPVSFIYGNIEYASDYVCDLLSLIDLYQEYYPTPVAEISDEIESLEFDFIKQDFPRLLNSIEEGANRIKEIVLSLRNFSRHDEAEMKKANLHSGIDSTLMILQHRLKEQPDRAAIQVIKHFGELPLVECYPGQLNQVFMNILTNAIDAIEEKFAEDSSFTPQIHITTELLNNQVVIRIADNGKGIPPNLKKRLFEPFFTTKAVGKGTGLGLAISYQIIVEKHQGTLKCNSQFGKGTEFVIQIQVTPESL